jgi:hypothetical protein
MYLYTYTVFRKWNSKINAPIFVVNLIYFSDFEALKSMYMLRKIRVLVVEILFTSGW